MTGVEAAPASKYDAFISYRRSDGRRHAKKLRRMLLDYRLPGPLRAARPQKLAVYLDTIYETASTDFFENTIAPALAASKRLIVVQTPAAVRRRTDDTPNWVEREVRYYCDELGRSTVSVALARGTVNDPLPANLDRTMSRIDRVDIRRLAWIPPFERRDGLIPLVATLYDVPSDQVHLLWREDARRRVRLFVRTVLVVALLALGLSMFNASVVSRQAERRLGSELDGRPADAFNTIVELMHSGRLPIGVLASNPLGLAEALTRANVDGSPARAGRTLDVLERLDNASIASRTVFGAAAFAAEEVALRHTEFRARAEAVRRQIRARFVAAHGELGTVVEADNPWVTIPSGSFPMGTTDENENHDEHPVHTVAVPALRVQVHEVTMAEYGRFDPSRTPRPAEGRFPVANVTWFEAMAYAAWIGGSLPTEAEWEYAARGREARPYPWGKALPTPEYGNFENSGRHRSAEVGRFPKGTTPTGLLDMAGNVHEWCRDWYAEKWYEDAANRSPSEGDLGPLKGDFWSRVVRGGSFNDGNPLFLLAAARQNRLPAEAHEDVGFRVVVRLP